MIVNINIFLLQSFFFTKNLGKNIIKEIQARVIVICDVPDRSRGYMFISLLRAIQADYRNSNSHKDFELR